MALPYALVILLCIFSLCHGAPNAAFCRDGSGTQVKLGDFYMPDPANPCSECLCTGEDGNNNELCIEKLCDIPDCPGTPINGTCCGWKCDEGCTDKNGTYVSLGGVYQPSENPCRECLCTGEPEELCFEKLCHIPDCPGTPIAGTCCGWQCDEGCTDRNGTKVPPGGLFKPSKLDPCLTCFCDNTGELDMLCVTESCEDPPQGHYCIEYEVVDGECCNRKCTKWEAEEKCIDAEGKEVASGEMYQPSKSDPCLSCTCEGGKRGMCMAALCYPPPPHPDCLEYKYTEGKCCEIKCTTWKDL